MTIWIRVITFTVDKEVPELGVVVYPSEAAAKEAVKTRGGLALPVDSAYLKTLFTPEQFSVGGVVQHSLSAVLEDHNTSAARHLENCFNVDYSSLDHHLVPEFVTVNDHEEMIHVTEFGAEAEAWFATLEAELECFVHVE
jgi:hypothetical protein